MYYLCISVYKNINFRIALQLSQNTIKSNNSRGTSSISINSAEAVPGFTFSTDDINDEETQLK